MAKGDCKLSVTVEGLDYQFLEGGRRRIGVIMEVRVGLTLTTEVTYWHEYGPAPGEEGFTGEVPDAAEDAMAIEFDCLDDDQRRRVADVAVRELNARGITPAGIKEEQV